MWKRDRSSSSKADIANAIQNARRQSKIPSFFAAAPTSKTSTSTASTDSSGSPAKKKSKPTNCINEEIASAISGSANSDKVEEIASAISGSAKSDEAEEIASVISGSAKSDKAKEIASVISGSAKSDEAEEIASVISGSAKSDKAEEEGISFIVIEEFALDKESKTPPPDPTRLEAYRKQIELLGLMRKISDENTALLDQTCPLPSLICQVAKWFIRLSDHWKKTLRNKNPPQPFVIFDLEKALSQYIK